MWPRFAAAVCLTAGVSPASAASGAQVPKLSWEEFRHDPGATPALLIGITHDTFAPFAWARSLARDLGNARLLTFRGDGHDALTSFNPCIVGAMLAYLEELALPAPGSSCRREPPF